MTLRKQKTLLGLSFNQIKPLVQVSNSKGNFSFALNDGFKLRHYTGKFISLSEVLIKPKGLLSVNGVKNKGKDIILMK